MVRLASMMSATALCLFCSSQALAHANACHRGYVNKADTVEFYHRSFKVSEILHLHVLKDRVEADNFLEQGVLADIEGKPAEEKLEKAMASLKASRDEMEDLYKRIGDLREYDHTHKPLPEHIFALGRILAAQPELERVSLTDSRFANVSKSEEPVIHKGPIGKDFDSLLSNLQEDLKILQIETDETIKAFAAVMPLAKNGGFAAMVLSGRAPLPEKIMHTVDQTMVYVQFFNRACMTSIAADMQVYPKGFEWLPQVNWKRDDSGPSAK